MANYFRDAIDDSVLNQRFDRLVENLQWKYKMEALTVGAKLLQKYTKEILLQKFPKAATAKGQGKRPMIQDIHIIKDNAYQDVMVSVLNYLTKWYEYGTDHRALQKDHAGKKHPNRIYRKGEARGQIKPLWYFREARDQHMDEVAEEIRRVLADLMQND